MDPASRARVKNGLDTGRITEYQRKVWEAKKTGQNDLFGDSNEQPPLELEDVEPWTMMEALEAERTQAFGFYLSGHPLDWLQPLLDMADSIRKNNEVYGSHLLNTPKETKGAKSRYKYR